MRYLLPLLAIACVDKGSGDEDEITTEGGLTTVRTSATTGDDGIATVSVDVAAGDAAFLVTASGEQRLAVEAVRAPDGSEALYWEDWYGEYSLTSAIYVESEDTTLNWPVREEDGPLESGAWEVDIAAVNNQDYYAPGEDMEVVIQTRQDDDLASGRVSVMLVYAQGVGGDADVVAATESAVERWAEIWAEHGLILDIRYEQGSIDSDLPGMGGGGSAAINAETAAGNDADITVILGETINGSIGVYGISGGIPGSLISGPRAAVVISWLANAGGDGNFSADDVRLFGETMAHEVGHYTGLFHPVEDGWSYWDALDDTDECTSLNRCETELGDNLMFPYPICSWTSCQPQGELTADQEGVMQRYTGTLQ